MLLYGDNMKLKTFNENNALMNSYLLFNDSFGIIIDPGFNGEDLINYCKQNDIRVKYVFLTHAHFDHIKDLPLLAFIYDFTLYVSAEDKQLLYNDGFNYARAYGSNFKMPNRPIIEFDYSKELVLDGEKFKIIPTPGHTKGSVCIKHLNALFSGDTLFFDSVGRTDLFGGNQKDLFRSITLLEQSVSNDAKVYPGHGQSGKMGQIKQTNPYIRSR